MGLARQRAGWVTLFGSGVVLAILSSWSTEAQTPGVAPSPSQTASSQTLAFCTALMAWGMDHPVEGFDLDEKDWGRVDLSRAKRLPDRILEEMLVPTYLIRLDTRDPWGRHYEILSNADPKQRWSWAIRSAGPDGRLCGKVYLQKDQASGRCDDIVRVDGVVVSGPVTALGY